MSNRSTGLAPTQKPIKQVGHEEIFQTVEEVTELADVYIYDGARHGPLVPIDTYRNEDTGAEHVIVRNRSGSNWRVFDVAPSGRVTLVEHFTGDDAGLGQCEKLAADYCLQWHRFFTGDREDAPRANGGREVQMFPVRPAAS
jgi:hypothetical protein